MSYLKRNIEDLSLPLPITQTAGRIARQFSQQQPTQEKAEQVRLNTLAVCVVNDYLQMMGIPCDLKASDSWNPVVCLFDDVADLEVVGLGRLECRAIAPNESSCYIPPEVWADRIGYVVVQLDELRSQAIMLGFAKQVTRKHLEIDSLLPLEDLLAHLSLPLPVAKASPSGALSQLPLPVDLGKTAVNLSQWLQNVFDSSWQTVESLLNPALALGFRKANDSNTNDSEYPDPHVRRAKLIDLGMQLAGNSIALVVELRPESERKTSILLQVHPTGSQIFLPPLLQMIVLDETEAVFLEAKARRADNYIQLQFSGTTGERFSVKLALGEVSITENFAI